MTGAVALIARMKQVPAVTALVGQRVHNVALPQSPTLPAIRVQLIGDPEMSHLRGGVALFRSRVQVDIVVRFAGSYETQARTIDAAVMGNRAGSSVAYWKGRIAEMDVLGILPPESNSGARGIVDAEDVSQYKVTRDFIVHHRGVSM